MGEWLLEELRDVIRSRFLVGLLVEECLQELQVLLRNTVYHLYREFNSGWLERTSSCQKGRDPRFAISLACTKDALDAGLLVKSEKGVVEQIEKEDKPATQDQNQLEGKYKNQSVQTSAVPIGNDPEEDILCIIRSFKINIGLISTLALGIMHNYSKDRYTVVTEQIELDTDDESKDLVAADGVKAGIEYSVINKQIMTLMNGYAKKNTALLLNKILKILVQDRNIVYGDIILKLIDSQCQGMMDTNGNDIEPVTETKPNTRSIGLNTDRIIEEITPPLSKRKAPHLRPTITQSAISGLEPVRQSKQYNQKQHLHCQQTAFQNLPTCGVSAQGTQLINDPSGNHNLPENVVVSQPQPLSQLNQLYNNPCNVLYGGHYQNTVNNMPDNNLYQPAKHYQRPTNISTSHTYQQPANAYSEELPLSLTKRTHKLRTSNQIAAKQANLKKQASTTIPRMPASSPTQYMGAVPLLHRDRYRNHTIGNISGSQPEQLQTTNVNPQMDSSETTRNLPMQMSPQSQYHMLYPDYQTQPMTDTRQTGVGAQINTLQAKPSYGMPVYSNMMQTGGTCGNPQTGTQMNCPPMYHNRRETTFVQQMPGPVYPQSFVRRRSLSDATLLHPVDMVTTSDNELTGGNMIAPNVVNQYNQMGQVNPYYGNASVMQDMNQPRMQTNA